MHLGRQLRDALRALCADFPAEYHRAHGAAETYPEEFGGSGLGLLEASIVVEEINRAEGERAPLPRSDVQYGHLAAVSISLSARTEWA